MTWTCWLSRARILARLGAIDAPFRAEVEKEGCEMTAHTATVSAQRPSISR
jgi:hypothetical protein